MRTFAVCILAATAFAQNEWDKDMDMEMPMDVEEPMWEMTEEQEEKFRVVKDLVMVFCEDKDEHMEHDANHLDEDHMWENEEGEMWDDEKPEMMDADWDMTEATVRSNDMDKGWEDEKEWSDSDSDDEHHKEPHRVKDDWMCRHAKKMMHELEEFHYSDHDGKKQKAHGWM